MKKIIDDCDYYLLLIGGRYGSLSPEGISYTEMEYDYAVSKGLKVIALIHGDVNNLPQIKCEKDPTLQEKLEKFRDKAKTGRLVKFWKNADQIAGLVSLSLSKTIKTYPAIGWVRADLVPSKDTSQEILGLQNKVKELEDKILQLKSKPEGLDSLSQGDDLIEVTLGLKAHTLEQDNYEAKSHYQFRVYLTWNNVFEYLSPSLIVENSENVLLELLKESITKFCHEELSDEIKKQQLKNISNLRAFTDDLRIILVQFRALRLIELSNKKHPPSDTNVYWTLTPYGDQLMTELNAIKRLS
ncbi:DUF4062 domain-containing protein [Acinetobacter cumulans]|nr:DUF4062 domain-containing protein [Acinetobacter cumulans]